MKNIEINNLEQYSDSRMCIFIGMLVKEMKRRKNDEKSGCDYRQLTFEDCEEVDE